MKNINYFGINQREVVTIAIRNNTAIMTNTALGVFERFEGKNAQQAGLHALIAFYQSIPTKKPAKVTLLLPSSLSFLTFKKTREDWIKNKVKKNGEKISHDLLQLIEVLHSLIKEDEYKGYIYCFDQRVVDLKYYKLCISATWKILSDIVPKEELIGCNNGMIYYA